MTGSLVYNINAILIWKALSIFKFLSVFVVAGDGVGTQIRFLSCFVGTEPDSDG